MASMWSPKNSILLHFFYTVSFANVVELAKNERLRDDLFNIKNTTIEIRDIQYKPVTEDEVKFYFYSSENPLEYIAIDNNNLERFRHTSNQIVFIIHGWRDSPESPWMKDMKNAFLIRDTDSFVIIVDWKKSADQNYIFSSYSTYGVAKYITKLMTNLYTNYGVDKNKFLLVGHSLGGHICGFIGKLFKQSTFQTLPRIVALDPAGTILFRIIPIDMLLNKGDAEVVEVIHTAAGTVGFPHACGTIDFFVNGGSHQPGCEGNATREVDIFRRIHEINHEFGFEWLLEFIAMGISDLAIEICHQVYEITSCNHMRANACFTEAIQNPTEYVAQKCESWTQYQLNVCDTNTVALGDLNTKQTGSFYLETNGEKPYAKEASKGSGLLQLLKP